MIRVKASLWIFCLQELKTKTSDLAFFLFGHQSESFFSPQIIVAIFPNQSLITFIIKLIPKHVTIRPPAIGSAKHSIRLREKSRQIARHWPTKIIPITSLSTSAVNVSRRALKLKECAERKFFSAKRGLARLSVRMTNHDPQGSTLITDRNFWSHDSIIDSPVGSEHLGSPAQIAAERSKILAHKYQNRSRLKFPFLTGFADLEYRTCLLAAVVFSMSYLECLIDRRAEPCDRSTVCPSSPHTKSFSCCAAIMAMSSRFSLSLHIF